MAAYTALSNAILTALRTRTRHSNERLIEQYVSAEVEVNKGALTSDEVLALKRLIQAQQAQQEHMKDEIKHNKATFDFLVDYCVPIPNEVRFLRSIEVSLDVRLSVDRACCLSGCDLVTFHVLLLRCSMEQSRATYQERVAGHGRGVQVLRVAVQDGAHHEGGSGKGECGAQAV